MVLYEYDELLYRLLCENGVGCIEGGIDGCTDAEKLLYRDGRPICRYIDMMEIDTVG